MMDRDPPWRGKDRPKRHGNKWWGGKHTIWQENPLTHWVFGHKWTQKMKGLLDNSWPKFTRKRIHLNRVLSLHFRCVKYRTSQSALASWVRRRNAVHLHTHPASYLKYHTWKNPSDPKSTQPGFSTISGCEDISHLDHPSSSMISMSLGSFLGFKLSSQFARSQSHWEVVESQTVPRATSGSEQKRSIIPWRSATACTPFIYSHTDWVEHYTILYSVDAVASVLHLPSRTRPSTLLSMRRYEWLQGLFDAPSNFWTHQLQVNCRNSCLVALARLSNTTCMESACTGQFFSIPACQKQTSIQLPY